MDRGAEPADHHTVVIGQGTEPAYLHSAYETLDQDSVGQEVEHYADGDVFDNIYPTHYHLLDRGGLWAWGNDVPDSMRPRMTVKEIWKITKGVLGKKLDTKVLGGMKRAMDRQPRSWLK